MKHRIRRTAAFTLLELILVLAVLAVFAAVTVPAVGRLHAEYRRGQAAERVLSTLAAVRMQAIDAGRDYRFLYEPDGRRFVAVAARVTPDDDQQDKPDAWRHAGELPDGFRFEQRSLSREQTPRDRVVADLPATFPNGDELTEADWSDQVTFRADGTSDDWSVDIHAPHSQIIRITVRGLTGAATTSRVE